MPSKHTSRASEHRKAPSPAQRQEAAELWKKQAATTAPSRSTIKHDQKMLDAQAANRQRQRENANRQQQNRKTTRTTVVRTVSGHQTRQRPGAKPGGNGLLTQIDAISCMAGKPESTTYSQVAGPPPSSVPSLDPIEEQRAETELDSDLLLALAKVKALYKTTKQLEAALDAAGLSGEGLSRKEKGVLLAQHNMTKSNPYGEQVQG